MISPQNATVLNQTYRKVTGTNKTIIDLEFPDLSQIVLITIKTNL